jgi:hypothetical protein
MASENKANSSASIKRAPPPALNPESCALTQPWKDFVSKGMISALRVEFTPMGNTIVCKVSDSLKKDTDTEPWIPIGDAKQRIVEAKLWLPKGKQDKAEKKDDLLPKRSLVKGDFSEEGKKKLSERARAVALALGDTTARGRIGSLKLMIQGVDTFDKWWLKAKPAQKSRLLTDAKHHKEMTAEDHAALAAAVPASPFRGSVPTPTHEEDDEEEEKESIPQTKRNGSPSSNK